MLGVGWEEVKGEISQFLSSTPAWTSVILAGKRCNRRYSTSGFSENAVVEREREGLTSFNKDNSAIFSGESKVQRSFPGCLFFYFLSIREKISFKLVVVLVLDSKGLW